MIYIKQITFHSSFQLHANLLRQAQRLSLGPLLKFILEKAETFLSKCIFFFAIHKMVAWTISSCLARIIVRLCNSSLQLKDFIIFPSLLLVLII